MMKMRSEKLACCLIITMAAALIVPGWVCASEPLVIGVSHWQKFSYSEMMKNSYQMALEDINKAEGIKGKPLKLVYADDQGKRVPGEQGVKDLIKAGAVMMIGGYSSANTVYTARRADKLDIPFLVCTAADDRITQRKWKNVFRLNPPASGYAKGLEDFLLKQIKPKSMAILYENSPYGTGSALRMMWFCRENEIEVRKIIPYHRERASSSYFKKLLEPVKEDAPDVIYMVSYLKDGVELVKTIRESKINSLLCGGAGGFTHQKFITTAGNAAGNMLTATLWFHQLPYPGTKAYHDQYVQKYGDQPDYHGAEAYSALLVAADALKRTQIPIPENIRAALNETDMTTPFGPVKFEAYGKFERQNRLPTMVLQIINGEFECIWPPGLESAKFVQD